MKKKNFLRKINTQLTTHIISLAAGLGIPKKLKLRQTT